MHIDNTAYQDRRAGVATSSTPCGPYTYLGASDPLGHQSRHLGLFKDDDGTAYLMHDDPAGSLRIDRLSADYTTAQSAVASFPELEAPAIAKVGGRYFLLASHLTGWSTNDNVYATATSLSGPWSGFTDVAPAGTSTYNSQTSFLLPVTGSAGTPPIYRVFVPREWFRPSPRRQRARPRDAAGRYQPAAEPVGRSGPRTPRATSGSADRHPTKGECHPPPRGDVPAQRGCERRMRRSRGFRGAEGGIVRVGTGGRRTAIGIMLIGVVAALTGCGGGGRTGAAASPSAGGMTDAQLQILVNNLVQCVRQHGAPGMPDVPVRNGHIVLPDESTVDQATKDNLDAARQACKAVEDRIPADVLSDQSNGRRSGDPTAADVPKERDFAKCMRDNGQPDWPDPKADGTFPGPDIIAAQGKQAVGPAFQACQKYYDGPIKFAS